GLFASGFEHFVDESAGGAFAFGAGDSDDVLSLYGLKENVLNGCGFAPETLVVVEPAFQVFGIRNAIDNFVTVLDTIEVGQIFDIAGHTRLARRVDELD